MSRKITSANQEARRTSIVQAASDVFLRYGYARTTMAELASAAQLSRPSLYEVFPSKEDLFAAVVRYLSQDTLQGYRKVLPQLVSLRAKLQRFCGDWATHGLRLVEVHPDAKDLFDLEVPAVREMYEDFIRFLEEEVVSSEPHNEKSRLYSLLRNLVFSLRGLEQAAHDVEEMERLVKLQVDVFMLIFSEREGKVD